MKQYLHGLALLALAFFLPATTIVEAQTISKKPIDIANRLRVEYDDNIREEATDTDDSFKIINELQLSKGFNFSERTWAGLRYTPSFTYWEDRPEDDTDFHHSLDARLNHQISPTMEISFNNTLRIAELPQLVDSLRAIRDNNDFMYNGTDVSLEWWFTELMRADVEFDFNILEYDTDEIADFNDYDQAGVGLSLMRELNPTTLLGLQGRYFNYDYEDDGRDAELNQIGLILEKKWSPTTTSEIRAGFETKDFDDANVEDTDSPYVSANLSYDLDRTQMEIGGSFSLAESPIAPYANQESTSVYARLQRDLSARINWALLGVYSIGEYDALETSAGSAVSSLVSGDEDVLRLSSKLSYEINRNNALEASIQYLDLGSDVRPGSEFDRTQVGLGWRLSL